MAIEPSSVPQSGLSTVLRTSSRADMPVWCIISDDLTGLQAVAGEFARVGLGVGTGISRLPDRDELQNFEVYGFDTATRLLPGADAEQRVGDALRHLLTNGAGQIFKHNDSTLQGHIGLELRAVAHARGARPVLYVPACPNRRRVTRGGIHQELNEDGCVFPSGLHRDLRECVSQGTGLRTGVMERATLHAGGAAGFISAATCDVLICDATTEEDLDLIVAGAQQAGCRVLAGSVGLAAALARAAVPKRRVQPVVVVAGSLQASTQRQVAKLLQRPDCASIRLELAARDDRPARDRRAGEMRKALSQGRHCVVWAPRETLVDAEPGTYPLLAPAMLEQLRSGMRALICEIVADEALLFGGLVVAGGATADLLLREVLRITHFTGLEWLSEGMTSAFAVDGARPGLAVVTKSGGWGPPAALCEAVARLSSSRVPDPFSFQTSSYMKAGA